MALSRVSLFKRSNGVWYILYDQQGRRRWKSTGRKLKSEALAQLVDLKEPPEHKPQTKRINEFAKEFLDFAEVNYARSSCDIFRVCLRNLLRIAGNCPLQALEQRHVDLYKTDRLKTKSPVSVNIELRSLRTILNYALRWKLIEENPFKCVQLVRVPEMPPLYFTKEQFEILLSVIQEEWFKEIVIFTVLTGMRRGEVCNLRWCDVDLERKLAHVHSTPTFRSKWGKQRVIPLNDWIVQRLSQRSSGEDGEYVFTFEGKKVDESYLTHKFGDYMRAARLNGKLHFHSLRHTFATWLVQQSVSIYEVQKLLGHSSIEMTQIYSHLQSEQLHGTVNKITLPLN